MKKVVLTVCLLLTATAIAQTCASISSDVLVQRFNEIKSLHANMAIETIIKDFQIGAEFIKQNIGENSKQYQFALTVMDEIKTMTLEEIMLVEDLRISIIPIIGTDQIYKEYKDLLLRDCRENLLAALILT
jgi:hypothetical protein